MPMRHKRLIATAAWQQPHADCPLSTIHCPLRSVLCPLSTIRSGFTLIEMLVTMALTLFVMVIISQAFATGLETFRQLKGIGDMQERLRTATTLLRSDLAEDHFEGKRRLSDGNIASDLPREGFFFLRMGPPLSPP